MKLSALFEQSIRYGIDADPRGRKEIERKLKKASDTSKKLSGKEKKYFDHERTWNPYADCRIINGTGNEDVKHLMIGIDIETPEVLLADRLREKGHKIDALFIHHPEGRALADLDKVMDMQIDIMAQVGVPVNHAEAMLRPRTEKIWRSIHSDNLFRTERAAELLNIPAFCCHTVTDNLVWKFMQEKISAKNWYTLGDVLDAITEIPEYEYYAKKGNPPILAAGSRSSRPGKISATEFTGGTNGPEEYIEAQSRAGVGTILSMHAPEKIVEEARKHHINIIQCSHMASDALGINLLIDKLERHEKKLTVLGASGFVRVKRK